MNEFNQPDSQGWTKINGQFGAILKDKNAVHPDAPGARNPTLVLRYGYNFERDGEIITVPDAVIVAPYWRAAEMHMERLGKIVSQEEAQPYLDKQAEEAKKREEEQKLVAQAELARLRQEKGEIPDPIDPDAINKINSRIDAQDAKLDAILAALRGNQG